MYNSILSIIYFFFWQVLHIPHFTLHSIINKQTGPNFEHLFSDCLRGVCNVCVVFLNAFFFLYVYRADNKNVWLVGLIKIW